MNKLRKLKRYLADRELVAEAKQLSRIIKNANFAEIVISVLPSINPKISKLVKNLPVDNFKVFNEELESRTIFDSKNNFCEKMQNVLYKILAKESRSKITPEDGLIIDSETDKEWNKFISELESKSFNNNRGWLESGIAPYDKSKYEIYKKYITFDFLNFENTNLKDNIKIFNKFFKYLFVKIMQEGNIKYKSAKIISNLRSILSHADSIVIHFYSKEDFDRGSNIINNIISEVKSKIQYAESLILTDDQREEERMRVSDGHDVNSSDTKDFSMAAANYLFNNENYKSNINDILNKEISDQDLFPSFVIITLHYTYEFFDQWKNMSYEDKKEVVLNSL